MGFLLGEFCEFMVLGIVFENIMVFPMENGWVVSGIVISIADV